VSRVIAAFFYTFDFFPEDNVSAYEHAEDALGLRHDFSGMARVLRTGEDAFAVDDNDQAAVLTGFEPCAESF